MQWKRLCRVFASVLGFVSVVAICGCGDWSWPSNFAQSRDPSEDTETVTTRNEADLFTGTVGQYAWFQGLRKMRVQGQGVVVGLGDAGSTECPREVRARILKELYKRPEVIHGTLRDEGWTPERLVDDPSTAVVEVTGEIPAGAVKGTVFDVTVTALTGTQVRSLRGGVLYPTELRIMRMVGPTAGIAGQVLARAAGPIFMNPFAKREGAATRVAERSGLVIGGGAALEGRRLQLELARPSHRMARAITDRINTRFPPEDGKKIADASSHAFIRLTVPKAYSRDAKRFLALVQSLYVEQPAGFADIQARRLADAFDNPNAPRVQIVMAWEGLGRNALPTIRPFYDHRDANVRYHAGLAGLRLGDAQAVAVVGAVAADPGSALREEAIAALAAAEDLREVNRTLWSLIEDDDPRIRVAALEALLDRDDRNLERLAMGSGGFELCLVHGSTEPMIYAKRGGRRCLAVFGEGLRCRAPFFYRSSDGSIVVSANEGEAEATVLRRIAGTQRYAAPDKAPFDIVDMVRTLGAGRRTGDAETPALDYGSMIEMLQTLCDTRSINARFMLEQPSMREIFGPMSESGRPESELE